MGTAGRGGPALTGGAGPWLGWAARGILMLIAAFWVWFCIADGLGDAKQFGIMGFIMMLPAAIIVLATLYVVWRWEFAGAWVLLGVTLLGAANAVQLALRSHLAREQLTGAFLINLGLMSLPFLAAALLLFLKRALPPAARR